MTNKTYEAEWTVWTGAKAKKHREPMSTHDIRTLLVSLGLDDVSVKRVASRGGAYRKQRRLITVGRTAPSWIVYHEIAHALADSHSHDSVFRREYIRVVRSAVGDWWAGRLELAFRRAKLPVAS